MKLRTYHNGDDAFIAWKPDGPIDDCRGFALLRRRNGVEQTVQTWVGFRGEDHTPGEHRDSTQWPIQRFQWSDYLADPGDRLAYKVIPMVGRDRRHLRPDDAQASDWSQPRDRCRPMGLAPTEHQRGGLQTGSRPRAHRRYRDTRRSAAQLPDRPAGRAAVRAPRRGGRRRP